jgi:hypothetical protein
MNGTDVPEMLSKCKPSKSDQKQYLAEVEQQMRVVFGGNKNPATKSITGACIQECCNIINRVIFGGKLLDRIPYVVGLNRERTKKRAGHCRPAFMRKGIAVPAEIKFNPHLLGLISVKDGEIGPRNCSGVLCRDKVAIIASVLMHEIVHLVIHHFVPRTVRKANKVWEPHGKMFMAIAGNIYGHTSHKAALRMEVTAKSVTKEDVHCGQVVTVQFNCTPCRGIVEKVNSARASVRIESTGILFRVPYPFLQRVDN